MFNRERAESADWNIADRFQNVTRIACPNPERLFGAIADTLEWITYTVETDEWEGISVDAAHVRARARENVSRGWHDVEHDQHGLRFDYAEVVYGPEWEEDESLNHSAVDAELSRWWDHAYIVLVDVITEYAFG